MKRRGWLGAALALSVAAGAYALTQDAPPAGRPQQGGGPADMGRQLVEALRATEGCLGAEAGRIGRDRVFIIAWFENRAAAMNWYEHPTHVRMMEGSKIDDPEGKPPMDGIPDDVPIMAIATMEFAGPPAVEGSQIPFSAISIELYTPLKGGLKINRGMAPDAFYELLETKEVPSP
jgi:hypothetical protein